jgi:VWFA-related protein
MRVSVLCIVLFSASFPAFAIHPVTIDQLGQQLASLRGKSDADAARQIADLKLTERLSLGRESDLEKALPGEKSREALRALEDESQVLAPPASEIPAQPAPDVATQRAIMGRVVAYVGKTLPQLPNFIATRSTTRFEDMPQRKADYVNKYEPLHPVSSAAAEVSYADGREVVDSGAKAGKNPQAERGLSTWGEFGPILSTVLVDAARNKLGWLRWERGDAGPLAVFAYSVPRENSHYEVDYCCVQDSEGRTHTFHELEAYEGEMAVDPATGAILRLMVRAQIKAGEPVSRADLVVEYGAVEIGGKSYICPVRSIALSRAQSIGQEQVEMVEQGPHGAAGPGMSLPVVTGSTSDVTQQTLLNEAAFTGYHVFRSETRVVSAAEGGLPPLGTEPTAPAASAPEPAAATANSAGAAPAGSSTPQTAAPAEASGSGSETASTAAPPVTPAAPTSTSPVAEAGRVPEGSESEAPEMVATAATDVPDLPGAPQAPQASSGFTLRTTSRLVDVPVVAFDKKGQPVTDLKPNELEVFDNGREQAVNFLSQAGAGTLTAAAEKPAPAGPDAAETVVTNRTVGTQANALASKEAHTTVLLIDSGNVAYADLSYARQEMLRFLKTVPADERVGLYILHTFGFQILLEPTEDHAQVAAKLAAWMPSAQDLLRAQHEEDKNRQNMDYVQHVTDLLYTNGNTPTGEGDTYHPVDPQLRSLGDNPAQSALAALQGVGRHLGAIPGQKSLVWVASDNVLADFSEKAPSNERGDKHLEPLVLLARETLNEAHVSLYPLDVSQLEGGGVGANLESANVQVKPTTNTYIDLLTLPPGEKEEANEALEKSQRDINPGRVSATLQQDTHPIQGVFRDLATATGGRALRRAGDIAAELNSIVADGRAAYLLSFTPDTPADGKYHVLAVKCMRPGVTLRFRNGYLYAQEPATMKERFREAVWQPRDENGIGLTATTVKEAKGPAVRLDIAGTDLAMAQQGGRWTDKVDVFLVVRDDSGLHASVGGKRLGLSLLPATYQRDMKDGLTVEEMLPKMPDGALVRLVVIDENSRRMGSVTVRQ